MVSKCYTFDLVILNVWINDFDYENNTLSVDVNFNNTEFKIESNPENPGEFKQGRTIEFKAFPEDLSLDLYDCPLKLKILANEEEYKGEAEFIWPKELLEKLEGSDFSQYTHFGDCDLAKGDGSVVGRINIHYRLRVRCEISDSEEETGVEKGCNIQNELKKIVDPNELFFLIQSDADLCDNMLDPDVGKKSRLPTALDLSKFKDFHGKVVKNPNLVDNIYNLDCCHAKKYPVYKSTPNCECSKPEKPKTNYFNCSGSKSSVEFACKAKKHTKKCPHSNKFSDESDTDCSFTSSFLSNSPSETEACKCPQTPPKLQETVYIRPRTCPICKNDVSWLPKLAACPKCGHKPTPYSVEKPYNEHLTAEDILADWAVSSSTDKLKKETTETKRTNRCSCKNGKICAFCRIRKICEGFMKTKKCSKSRNSEVVQEEKSATKICKSESETDSRTYLAKVFSELQDLYNLKPKVIKNEFKYNKKCEESFKEKPSKSRKPQQKPKTKKEAIKKLSPADARKVLCRKKLYNYKTVRKYPGTLIGHKSCVSSGQVVPPNMGWLWTANTEATCKGWKPGAIRKPIKEIMRYFLKDFPIDTLNVSKHNKNKPAKTESKELIQKPTLHICKKKGVYFITMRPIKEATLLKNCADPYVQMKPIQFRIVKNPKRTAASEIKKKLKQRFDRCTCHFPISKCCCRTYLEKKHLQFELNKLCCSKGIPNLKDSLVLSDTSDSGSDAEFEFGVTPPAGVIKPQLARRPDLACRETQYSEEDCIVKPMFPKPLNKYMKAYDVTGGRLSAAMYGLHSIAGGGAPGGDRGGRLLQGGPMGGKAGNKPGGVGGGAGGTSYRGGKCSGGCFGHQNKGGAMPIQVDKRNLPLSGIVGGWGGVGGNTGAGRITGGGPSTKPLFINLARLRKACCYTCPAECTYC